MCSDWIGFAVCRGGVGRYSADTDSNRRLAGVSTGRSIVNGWVRQLVERARVALMREEGQGMTEYGLIVVLIGIVVILMLGILGHQVNNVFSNISNGLNT
jgi:pilus assembly protein Flp/PilA